MFNEWKAHNEGSLEKFHKENDFSWFMYSWFIALNYLFFKILSDFNLQLFGVVLSLVLAVNLVMITKALRLFFVWRLARKNKDSGLYYIDRQDDIVSYSSILSLFKNHQIFCLVIAISLSSIFLHDSNQIFICIGSGLFLLFFIYLLFARINEQSKYQIIIKPKLFFCFCVSCVVLGELSPFIVLGLVFLCLATLFSVDIPFLTRRFNVGNWCSKFDYAEVDKVYSDDVYKDVDKCKKFSFHNRELRNSFVLGKEKLSINLKNAQNGILTAFMVEVNKHNKKDGSIRGFIGEKKVFDRPIATFSKGWNVFTDIVDNASKEENLIIENTSKATKVFMQSPYFYQKPKEPKTIIVLVVDALMKEMLSIYGGEVNTPHIDAFFSDGCRFTNAWAQGEWTTTNFAHMFTSMYSSHHKSTNRYDGYKKRFPTDQETIAEVFQKNDWLTYYFAGSQRVSQSSGYDRGFNTSAVVPYTKYSNKDLVYRALDVLDTYEKENKLLFLHLMDVHGPPLFWSHKLNRHAQFRNVNRKDIFRNKCPEEFFNLYKSQIEEFDLGISLLLSYLNRPELRDNTAVILTADHGQMSVSQDNDPLSHKDVLLSNMMLNVPMLLRCPWMPDIKGKTFDCLVESGIDLYPTLLNIAGLEAKTSSYSKSFITEKGKTFIEKDYVITESIYEGVVQQVIRKKDVVYYKKFGWRDKNIQEEDVWYLSNGKYSSVEEQARGRLFREFRKIILELKLVKQGDDPIDFYGSF